MSEQLVPEIRVAGFDGPWLGKRLQDLVDVIGGGTPSTTVPAFWGGEIDWYSPSEIGASSTTPPSRQKITQLGLVSSSAKALPGGRTVLFTSRASIGHAAILDHDATTNQGFQSLVTKQDTDVQFLYAMTSKIAEYARSQATGSTFLEVSSKALREMDVVVPSAREQRAIGSVLRRFTCAIEEHQKKHRQLKQAKASLMQRMFPAPGANEPEIRFEGFTGEWKEFSLLNLINSIVDFRGRTPKKLGMEWAKSGHLALSANNVKSGYIDFHRDVHYGDATLYHRWMGGRELYAGQVLFTTEAPMGNVAQVPDNRGYILSQRVIAFVPDKDRLGDDFLRALLESPSVVRQLNSLLSGGTAKGVSQKALSGVLIKVPQELDEQRRVADLLLDLDLLTQAEAQYVSKLQQVKSALLQKMFV